MASWSKHRANVVLALLVALAVKVYSGIAAALDLGLADESFCLGYGRRLLDTGLPAAQFSPLYAVWYFLLSRFEPDPVRLYTLNWIALQLGLVVALFVLARRSGASPAAGAAVASAWMLSHVVVVWPYVTYFSTLLLAVAAIAATYVRDRLAAAALVSIALSLVPFVRPELWLPALGVTAVVVALLVRRAVRTFEKKTIALGVATLLAPLVGRAIFGNPRDGHRDLDAFAQHYALNRVEDGRLPIDPWGEWESFFRPAFPKATTLVEAARENPSAMAWHLKRNLGLLPSHLGDLAAGEPWLPRTIGLVANGLLLVTLLAGLFGLVRQRRSLPDSLLRWLPLAAVVLAVATTASLVIYPREHYLVPAAFFLLALGAAGTGGALPVPPRSTAVAASLLALALVVTPTWAPNLFPSLLAPAAGPQRFIQRHTVDALRALDVQGHVVTLEALYSPALYAKLDFEFIWHADKRGSFWSFVHARRVDLIVIDGALRDSPRYRDDPEFQAFVRDADQREDFRFFPVPGEDIVLAVRARVLKTGR